MAECSEIKVNLRKEFSYEFSNVCFPSETSDAFRANITSTQEGVVFWLEHKKSKNQWQALVKDVPGAGDSGTLPEEVILESIKRAFTAPTAPEGTTSQLKADPEAPTADLKIENGKAILTLMLSLMGGIWKSTYRFTLSPVALEKLTVLEAKLRDADEEIELLRRKMQKMETTARPAALSICSKTSAGYQQMVGWDGLAPRLIANSHFSLSADNQKVTVLKTGLYQVNVRLSGTNNTNGQFLGLQLNGTDVAQCIQCNANGFQGTAQIFEIMELQEGDFLQVRCGYNSNSLVTEQANRFTMLFLGN